MIQEFSEWFLRNPRIQPDAVAVDAIPKWKWPVSPPTNPRKSGCGPTQRRAKTVGKSQLLCSRWFSQLSGVTFRVKTQSPTRISTLLDLRSQVKPTKYQSRDSFLFLFWRSYSSYSSYNFSSFGAPWFGIQLGDSPLIPKRRGPEAVYQSIGSRCKVFSRSGASKSPIPGRKKITAVTI